MGEIRVYESKPEPCRLCNERQGVLMPFCKDGDREPFFFLVCPECRDKVPYEVIPIKVTMDPGYFYCPEIPKDFDPSRVIVDDAGATWVKGQEIDPKDFDPKRPILTRYGKKLLIHRAREQGTRAYLRSHFMSNKERARELALQGWQLLASEWIEDHIEGLCLLDQAKELDPEEYAKVEREIENESA